MSRPKRNPMNREGSVSSLEYSLSILAEPQSEPITIYPGPGVQGSQMSKADLEIVNRLQQLRSEQKTNLPTEEEMTSRLAALKGLPSNYYSKKSNSAILNPKPVSETQQIENLLSQVSDEVRIDKRLKQPEDELEERLAKLRGYKHARAVPDLGDESGDMLAMSSATALSPSEALPSLDMLEDICMFDDKNNVSMKTAKKEVDELKNDPKLANFLASHSHKKDMQDKEMYSDSDSDNCCDSAGANAQISLEDATNAEVQKIINRYSKVKTKKKKQPKNKNKDEDSDYTTSESEKLSNTSSEHSDSETLSD